MTPAGAGRALTRGAVWALGLTSVGFLLVVGVGPHSGRYRTLTVLSGSMQPAIPEGAVVVVTPQPSSQVRVGQVITYAVPEGDHHIVSHRVVDVLHEGDRTVIQTKGDANDAPDPWLAEIEGDTVWQVRLAVPAMGRVINWLRQPLPRQVGVLVVPAVLAAVWMIRIWRPAGVANPARGGDEGATRVADRVSASPEDRVAEGATAP